MSSNKVITESGRVLTFRNKKTTSPSDVHDFDAFALRIVAVVGQANDWAAYYGPTSWSNVRVAEAGIKLDADTAKRLFYVLRKSGRMYRH